MGTTGSRKLLSVTIVWVLVAGALAAAYKYWVANVPKTATTAGTPDSGPVSPAARDLVRQFEAAWDVAVEEFGDAPDVAEFVKKVPADEQAALRQRLAKINEEKAHRHPRLELALDAFSGYCVLRSSEFKRRLRNQGYWLHLRDDGGKYQERLERLKSGQTPLAVFTVDALINTSAALDSPPAQIVLVLDESRGADAMIAYRQALPNIDALNKPGVKIVLTRDSPSETLARVVKNRFDLRRLEPDCFAKEDDSKDVLNKFLQAGPGDPRAFVLWEPLVARALKSPGTHVLVDSSRFDGYIVDVLVASRQFLEKNQDGMTDVVKAYLEASQEHEKAAGGMVRLVVDDAKKAGDPLDEAEARRVVGGIWWKNTRENYAHFGLAEAPGVQPLPQMVRNITTVLRQTGAISRDPTGGDPTVLFSAETLRQLQRTDFADRRPVRPPDVLPALTEEQWKQLQQVYTVPVEPIRFARGSSDIPEVSRPELDKVLETMATWPRYYLQVRGHVSPKGDPEANRMLARERAEHVREELIKKENPNRIRIDLVPAGDGDAQVSFVLLQDQRK
jgi:hypothetical protein